MYASVSLASERNEIVHWQDLWAVGKELIKNIYHDKRDFSQKVFHVGPEKHHVAEMLQDIFLEHENSITGMWKAFVENKKEASEAVQILFLV